MKSFARNNPNLADLGPVIECILYNPNTSELIKTFALIDTGGMFTIIDLSIINKLSLVSERQDSVRTIDGDKNRNFYNVKIFFGSPDEQSDKYLLEGFGYDLSLDMCKIIIGRDFLKRCIVYYDGTKNQYGLEIY